MIDTHAPLPSPAEAPEGMCWIPGGTFRMGATNFYPEERPVREITVDGFWIDRFAVTNEQFARFVEDSGYVTIAERAPNPEDFPGAPAENLVPGSMVFQKRSGPVDLATTRTGGRGCQAPAGGTRQVRRARSKISLGTWPATCGNGPATGGSPAGRILR